METQKIINFLNASSNEKCRFATKKNGILETVKQQKINTTRTIRLKVLNRVFVIILMHLF